MTKQLFIALFIFTFAFNLSNNAQNELYLKKEFIYKTDTLLYRVLFPKNYDKSKDYPLTVFLHGSGERGNDNEKQLLHGSFLFTDSINLLKYPSIVIFPQCPENDGWVNYTNKTENTFTFGDKKKPTKPLEMVLRLIKFYNKTESVDSKRIYVAGLSLGAMGTYDLICRYPNTFAAAIPICGAVNLDRLKNVRKVPICIFHGSDDSAVSVEYSRNAYIELKESGSQHVEYKEYPHVGHNCWEQAFAEPDFMSWLFSQQK